MTASDPPTPRIVGSLIGRWMEPSEIPSTIPVEARRAVGLLGHEDIQYRVRRASTSSSSA